ncbi:sulfatase family protein [Parapedobacter tibetensis]|uniref:sulfatase family protein n=1 Tax=Parapedobacter tibetensis TaxID=2972951 RepID=UPI00214D9959|nr:sulfatase [Parapedobacter tibetensis]
MKQVNILITFILGCLLFFIAETNGQAISNDDYEGAKQAPNILVLIADDWGYPNAGAYGDNVVQTPNFDRIAKQGVLFTNAFTTPSCSPSRASLLTGQWPHQLEEGVHLKGFLNKEFPNYVELLAKQGYATGLSKKGWGPGKYQLGGYEHNPAGPTYPNFETFFENKSTDQPFCFWFGSHDPHRPYEKDSGIKSGRSAADVQVPAFLPDNSVVRGDILDYYHEIERFDHDVGEILAILEAAGELDNTLIVVTGDNGMPFPRAKANLYDTGTHIPLAISWPARIKPAQLRADFVSFVDLAPTFLASAGIQVPDAMTGTNLLSLMTGGKDVVKRDKMFVERERHAYVREGNVGYPSRGIRTKDFLYIRNFRSDRWPAGDPEIGTRRFGDIDKSPTKDYMMIHKDDPEIAPFFERAFMKRPAEELYDLTVDPDQLTNVVGEKQYAAVRKQLSHELNRWMQETNDPRLNNGGDYLEDYPYQ